VAALRALLAVEAGERSEDALAREAPPAGPDRALAWRLCRGVLQTRAEADAIIGALSKRPLRRLDPVPLQVLRLGLFELRHGRTPDHAAVNEAVQLCRRQGAPHAAGFVNALLRRHEQAPPPSPEQLLNHPAWLLARWRSRYGEAAAAAWARKNNSVPPLALVFKREEPELLALLQRELGCSPASAAGQQVSGAWLLRARKPVRQLPGYDEGLWWVQDGAAAAVADLVGAQPGWRVLDACAAPGGKSFRLISQGAEVWAADRSKKRLERLSEGATRLGMAPRLVQHDWQSSEPFPQTDFDAVLADAPCSGLGTLRRHPEIRWRRRQQDLHANAERQLAILRAAAACCRVGGVLVYVVCSPEPEEGEQVAERFLQGHPGYRRLGGFCSAPPCGEEDAFWAVKLQRG